MQLQAHVLELKVSELENFCSVFLSYTVPSGIARQWMIVTNAGRQDILIERDCALGINGVGSAVVEGAYKWRARQL